MFCGDKFNYFFFAYLIYCSINKYFDLPNIHAQILYARYGMCVDLNVG